MKKIITLGITLKDEHMKRLQAQWDVEVLDGPESVEDFLHKTANADVIYSNGDYLLESLPKLKDVFVVYPYVELGAFNSEELEKNNVFVANSQGWNRNSIIERVMYMTLALFRNFIPKVRTTENIPFALEESLDKKKVLIIGHGNIGSQIGSVCEAFGMEVIFFERGDNVLSKSEGADLIINALNCNTSTKNLLNEWFFMNVKKGAYYITFVRPYTYDIDGLIKAIDTGIIAGVAIDCDPEEYGDTTNEFYMKALGNPKILVTPHIAFATKQASENGREIAIQNIEAFCSGTPKNIVRKK